MTPPPTVLELVARRMPTVRALLCIAVMGGAGCGAGSGASSAAAGSDAGTGSSAAAPTFVLGSLEFHGSPSSGMPHLFGVREVASEPGTADGAEPAGPGRHPNRILMSWHEQVGPDRWALRVAERRDGRWTEPRTVAERESFFVNWADFPSLTALEDGSLLVHWLEKVGEGPYAYHVLLSMSRDGGATWSEPFVAHQDEQPTEHGFVSVVPWEGGAALVWLDGRAMDLAALETHAPEEAEAPADYGAMTLRARTVAADGTLGEEQLLDDRTCECCTTALARAGDDLVVAYRDRSPEEIRDIYVTRLQNDRWTEPRPVHRDDWHLPGCPVNGPQLAADGDRVALSWFTAAHEQPRVHVAFSDDGGASWGEPIRVDEGRPLGRVDVELLADGAAAVSWIETAGDLPRVQLRLVEASGLTGPPISVTEISAARSSGFPRMARAGDELLVAWTDPGAEGGVRVRAVRVEGS